MKHNYVPDGCFLLARVIFESAIWRDDPHVLKLFIYLIGNARHKKTPKKYPSFEIKRGELVTSLAKIAEENEYHQNGTMKTWARMKISRMLDLLEKQGYIKKLCDTYGTHISICNYDVYQDLNNYKCDTVVTPLLQDCYDSVTGVLLNKKGIKDNKEKKETPLWEIPEGINIKAWEEFEQHRKGLSKDKQLTDLARTKAANKLLKLAGSHDEQQEVIDQTIERSYTGLFPIEKKGGNGGFKSRTEKNTAAKEEFLKKHGNQEKDVTPEIKTLEV